MYLLGEPLKQSAFVKEGSVHWLFKSETQTTGRKRESLSFAGMQRAMMACTECLSPPGEDSTPAGQVGRCRQTHAMS